jgi:phosphoenolpyruvate carboxylase
MISAKYLLPETAQYSLELMAGAVLHSMNVPLRRSEKNARVGYIDMFTSISAAARNAYMSLTRHPDFWTYFRSMTPIDIIEKIEIGSRPASRTVRSRLSSIRAIPWVFSWTQCRQAITGWYGFGSSLEAALKAREISWSDIRDMYTHWPFFRALVRNIEMVLAKTDLRIAKQYLGGASNQKSASHFFTKIQGEYELSRSIILRIKKQRILLESDPSLRQSLLVRNPYIDPISFIQVRFLREFRRKKMSAARRKKMLDLLRSSINGIAAGMRNTG